MAIVPIYEHVLNILTEDINNPDRYSKQVVKQATIDAVSFIATLDPRRFTRVENFKLQPGSIQHLPDNCIDTSGVLQVVDADGKALSVINQAVAEEALAFSGLSTCRVRPGDYTPQSFSIPDDLNGIIIINPPVPKSGEFFIAIQCVVDAESIVCSVEGAKTFAEHRAAIVEYALYIVMAGEDDQRLNNTAQSHFNNFIRLVGIARQLVIAKQDELNDDSD